MSTELLALLTGLLLLSAGVFGGGIDRLSVESGFFPRLKKAFGILATVTGIYLLFGFLVTTGVIFPGVQLPRSGSGAMLEHTEKIPWRTDLTASLADARQANKPVVIDTWATWCANCKRLDKQTWADDQVAAEAGRFVPVKLQLETNGAQQTKEFLQLFALKQYSLPTTIILDSNGEVQDIIFGFIDAEDMLERLRAVS